MHPYVTQEIARQREGNLRRAAANLLHAQDRQVIRKETH